MPVFSLLLSLGIVFGLAFWLHRKTAESKTMISIFWLTLSLRLVCGLLLGWFYQEKNLYGGDTLVYQKTANLLTNVGYTDFSSYANILLFNEFSDPAILTNIPYPTYTNSFFLVKIVSLLNFITSQNYYLNSLFLSLFSFAGCWVLALKLGRIFPGSLPTAVLALLFFPSVNFWNSGIMKDGILLATLGFFWASVLYLSYYPNRRAFMHIVVVILASILLWKIKFFVAAFVFAITGSWFCLRWAYLRFPFFRSGFLRWLAIPALIGVIVFIFSLLHYKFNLPFLLMSLVLNHELFLKQSLGKPVIELAGLEANLPSVLTHTPEAVFGILFRPFLGEGNTVFYLMAGLENLILLLLFLSAFLSFRKFNLNKIPGFYFVLLVFVVCLAMAFGLSTPNLGSLNRYRTIFLPFFIFLLLQTPFWKQVSLRVTSKLKRLRA